MINERIEKLKSSMREEGITRAMVAAKLGVSVGTIAYWLKYLKHPWLIDRIEEAAHELVQEKCSKLGAVGQKKAPDPPKAKKAPAPVVKRKVRCDGCVWGTMASAEVRVCAFPRCIRINHEARQAQNNN